MIPSVPVSGKSQRQLLKLFSRLSPENKEHVIAFAEFLASRDQSALIHKHQTRLDEPDIHPRPEKESVVAAIKRLSKSYSMINKDDILHETSDLMSAHILKGRPAEEVIDDLELLFLKHYKKIQTDTEE